MLRNSLITETVDNVSMLSEGKTLLSFVLIRKISYKTTQERKEMLNERLPAST